MPKPDNNKSNKCTACGKFMAATDGAPCVKCKNLHHYACIGIQDKAKVPPNWVCPDCKAKVPRKNSDDTPVKTTERESKQSPRAITPEKSVAEELKLFRGVFKKELSAMRLEMQEFRRELSNLSASLTGCDKRIDDLEAKVVKIEVQCSKINHSEYSNLEATIIQLKADLNDRDQELLQNDIDITGVPEAKAENTTHIVLTLASKMGVTIDETDIVQAERVGLVRNSIEGQPPRARPIVVKFCRRKQRDEMLRAARVRRQITTSDMNFPDPPRRLYINERLTKLNRLLFNKIRAAAKSCKWKFTWTRDGKIYTRQNEGKPSLRIRTEADINRIFGTDSV